MAGVLILGAGMGGLPTATRLARAGHEVTVLERDPSPPPAPECAAEAWDGWSRRGVNQFRRPHVIPPRWWSLARQDLPDVGPALQAAGARTVNSLSVLTLPADNGVWSVVSAVSSQDADLRGLRDLGCWQAVVARYPLAAHWTQEEALSVEVMAGIEDRRRWFLTGDGPVATGVVALGDAWACTNPSLGRGTSMAPPHACLLRDLIGHVDPGDHVRFAVRFGELTEQVMGPLYEATLGYDRHRLAEIQADVTGVPYRTPDPRWLVSKALTAAALQDPELLRAQLTISSFLAPPDQVLADPGLRAGRWPSAR